MYSVQMQENADQNNYDNTDTFHAVMICGFFVPCYSVTLLYVCILIQRIIPYSLVS